MWRDILDRLKLMRIHLTRENRYLLLICIPGLFQILPFFTPKEKIAENHYKQGLEYFQRGYHHEANVELLKAIEVYSQYGSAYYLLGKLQYSLDNFTIESDIKIAIAKATDYFNKAIAFNPNDPFPLVGLGDIYYKQGRIDDAIKMYTKANGIYPNCSESNYMIALCYWQKGQPKKAKTYCKKVKELKYDPPMGRKVALDINPFIGNSVCDLLK